MLYGWRDSTAMVVRTLEAVMVGDGWERGASSSCGDGSDGADEEEFEDIGEPIGEAIPE